MKRIVEFFSKSFKTKMVAAFLLIGLIPLCVVGYLSYKRSAEALVASTAGTLQARAAATLDKIDRNLFERYGDVQAFAFNPMARGTAEEKTQAANFYMTAYGCYDLMLLADAEGKIVAANTVSYDGKPLDTKSLIGRSVRGEAWFDECAWRKNPIGRELYRGFE